MSRLRTGIAVVLISALGVFAAGCGGDDDEGTPAGTTTPTATSPAPSGGTGDVAAGKTFFEGGCQGCHNQGGTVAGNGPVLAGKGLTEDAIRNQVVNGGGGMPPGLASGADLDNVVAFVASIQ